MQPFARRRSHLQNSIEPHSAILIRQPKHFIRNNSTHYPFHPDRHFYYLTGFEEPNAWLLITKEKTYLWSQPVNALQDIWTGPVLGDKAAEQLSLDSWYSVENFSSSLAPVLASIQHLFTIDKSNQALPFSGKISDGKAFINEMRIIKDEHEIQAITKACSISSTAHNHVIALAKYAYHETALMGHFIQSIMAQGACSQAYPPIVASGENALTLHYTNNNQPIDPKGLILIDAGCEYKQYASDISRTFPANGQFTKEQQALYEACLDTQTSVIKTIKPGIKLSDLHKQATTLITQHLIDLKLITLPLDEAIEKKQFTEFFPHSIGHPLGLDVHDILSPDSTLHPNMIITVEPGLYIRQNSPYQHMGIRIEDNILITESGYKNLTETAVKSIDDIQHLMQS